MSFSSSTRYATVQLIVGFGVQTYSRKSNRAYYSENLLRREMWWAWVFECFGSHEHSSFCIAWMGHHPHYDICTKCSSTRNTNIHVFCSQENKGHLVSAQIYGAQCWLRRAIQFQTEKHNDEIQWLSCYCCYGCYGWWWSAPPVHCTQQNEAKRNETKTVGKINGTKASERVSGQTDAITINVENQNKNKCDAVVVVFVVVIRLFHIVQRH